MEFGILGPLAVWRDGREVELGAAKQRALLAAMLLHAGETMPTERLVDALWGEKPPPKAVKALQVYISQLRKRLGQGVIETRPLGYVVRVEDGSLDLHRFERMLAEGRRLLDEGAAVEAGVVLREALGLWRGEPLADFRYEAFAANAIGRLDELRVIALEQRLEADLATGRHADAVPELEALVREYPLREGLRGLLMRALYRSGRQADALTVMQDTRTTLRDELGLDPSQALQQLEKAILLQDPSLDLPAPAAPIAPPKVETEPAQEWLAAPPNLDLAARAQRKVVTVLFADITDSTLLGESFDPEVVRAMLAKYFERMKAAAERHGGVVEKFIGDAVMAVFGVPAVHEDDALRALRAATEMRDAIVELGMEGRIGLESGEVVVGTPERLVTGRAVTTAARLEQAAQPGEILLGQGTIGLAGTAVTAEPLEPLVLKGKPEPVPAWRLVSVSPEPPVRDSDSPLVGRGPELALLHEAWERIRTSDCCELVTVVGPAGVGKSRLVSEFLSSVDSTLAQGRCLSYGAGITYWPVVEVLTELLPKLGESDEALAAPLRALVEGHGASSTDELAWSFRKFVETIARSQPLVLVFDDIQWAEQALLDLIEHVAFVSSGAPILLVCMARPELLGQRPGWRSVMELEPLTPDEAEQLIRARLGDRQPNAEVSQRIVAAAEGNPLFVQELADALQDSDDEQVTLPSTIQAVLAARIDQLDADERTLLEAAAVEGEVFHAGAVQTLAPDQPRPTATLTALVRKDLVRPDRSVIAGEDAFRFRHLLLRDVTYDAIPKATRTGLHQRYADWLEERTEALDAFIGYHLEQAYRYRVELQDTGAETDAIARRASERLEVAAAAALERSDLRAASGLLERAASLPPVPDEGRSRLLTDLAATLMDAGELMRAEHALAEASTLAAAAGDVARARREVECQFLELHHAAPGATDGVGAVTERVIPVLEQVDDHHGLCRAWQLQAAADWTLGHVAAAADAWERAASHALQAREQHRRSEILTWLASSTFAGSLAVDDAVARCEEIQDEVRGHPAAEAQILQHLAGLHGFAGRFELARSLFAARNAAFADLGLGLNYLFSHSEAIVEMLAGNFAAAEQGLRTSYETYEAMGERAFRSTTAAFLARAILAQGRDGEAEHFCEISEELAEPNDLLTQIMWRGISARLLAARGRLDEAERLALEAVALAECTDFLHYRADALIDLAAVLEAADRTADASEAFEEALRLYEQKGCTVAAGSTRAHLDALAAV